MPVGVVAVVVMERVVVPVAVMVVGEKAAVAPVGSAEAEKAVCPVKPLSAFTDAW